jgi:hypothetical protein
MNGPETSLKSSIFKQWENDQLLKFIFIIDSAVYEEYLRDQSFKYTGQLDKANSERKKEARRKSKSFRLEQYVLN